MPDKQIIPADAVLPGRLHIIPTMGAPVFPGIFTPMMIESTRDIQVVETAMSSDNLIGLLLLKNDDTGNPTADDLYQIGTVARIVKRINLHFDPEAVQGEKILFPGRHNHRRGGVPG
jgi:ATP-dependent Lon protease